MNIHNRNLITKLNRTIAILITSILFLASNVSIAIADDKDTSSWVDTKDDWRHGIIKEESSSGGNFSLGNATGEYAITLCDGSWYWYHQTNGGDNCTYCGDWSSARWGSKFDLSHTIGRDGCGVYSMAIIISNLTGQVVDPINWLEDNGCKVTTNTDGRRTSVQTNDSPNFSGRAMNAYEGLLKVAEEKYGLSYTENMINLSKDEQKKRVDEVLDRGGMIWIRTACYNASSSKWPYYTTSSHYIPIRSRDDKGYYILDECQNNFDRANEAVSWDTIYNNEHRSASCLFGIWNENMAMIGKGNSDNNKDGTASNSWYTPAKSIGNGKETKKKAVGNNSYYLYYDGLPWKANNDTYIVDTDAMLYDLFDYVNKESGGVEAQSSWGNITAKSVLQNNTRMYNDSGSKAINSENWKGYGLDSQYSNERYYKIDDVKCVGVCLPQAVLDRNYCDKFGAYSESQNMNYWSQETHAMTYNYGKAKIALALKEKSTGKICYLPATLCDAKAHTFPGGVAQTGITLSYGYGPSDNYKWELDSSGNPVNGKLSYVNGSDFGGKWDGNIAELAELMNKKIFGYDSYTTAWDSVWNIAEVWCANKAVDNTVISSGNYRLVGVVVWADTVEGK